MCYNEPPLPFPLKVASASIGHNPFANLSALLWSKLETLLLDSPVASHVKIFGSNAFSNLLNPARKWILDFKATIPYFVISIPCNLKISVSNVWFRLDVTMTSIPCTSKRTDVPKFKNKPGA